MNDEHVQHHMHAHNPTVRVELEKRTNLDLSRRTMTRTTPWGRCRECGSARGSTDERKRVRGLRPVQPTHPSFKHSQISVCTRVCLSILPMQNKFGTTAAHRSTGNGCACRNGPRLCVWLPSELPVEVRIRVHAHAHASTQWQGLLT